MAKISIRKLLARIKNAENKAKGLKHRVLDKMSSLQKSEIQLRNQIGTCESLQNDCMPKLDWESYMFIEDVDKEDMIRF